MFRTLVKCAKPAADTEVLSPVRSISAFTLAKQPFLKAETEIDEPTTITITFSVGDTVAAATVATGYTFVLERGDNKIQGTIDNPYVDSGLEPATQYEYTGWLKL